MKKIKVLFRHRSMEMGGVEKVILNTFNNLPKDKFDFTLCLNLNQGEFRNQVPSHVRKVALTAGKEDLSKNPILHKLQLLLRKIKLEFYRNFPKYVDDKILKDQYDVEIASTYGDFQYVANSPNKNSKKIAWLHSDLTHPKLKGVQAQLLSDMQKFDYIIYGSQQSKDILVETFPDLKLPEGKFIPNAIPINDLKNKANEYQTDFNNIPTFVSVGRLHSRKGYHTLMAAHAKLIKDGYNHQIIVIGDGPEMVNLQQQAEDLDVKKSFKLLGTMMNPYPYVKNADFYILSSDSEGWPLIIAETLILQTPIISTKVGSIDKVITHKKNGYFINYSIDEMYNAMKLFLTDEDLVNEIKENLKSSEEQFDNKKIFDSIEDIITILAKRN